MGRRALRRIDRNLDLSRYLRTSDQLPHPWDTDALFGQQAPLEIEVGSGKGMFLVRAAALRPQHNFLGIEVSRKYARFAAARLHQRDFNNSCIACGDAQPLFRSWFPQNLCVAVHIYFPDPWWKKRHHKRRLMNQTFLQDVERVLVENGRFHFWTDVEAYFSSSLQLVNDVTSLTGPFPLAERDAEHDLDFRTHFERRMFLKGEPVFRAEFCKRRSDECG